MSTPGTRPRVLFVTDEFGRPENTGYRRRVAMLVRALATVGDVTWVVLAGPDADGLGGPLDVGLEPRRVPLVRRPRPLAVLRWATSRLPWRMAAVDDRAVRRGIAAALGDRRGFDVVVCTRLDNERLCAPFVATAASVTDIDDLESHKLRHRLAADDGDRRLAARAKRVVRRIDVGRWARLERAAAASHPTFVCSDLDRARLDGRTHVVANPAPAPPPGFVRAPDPARPVLLFVGSLTYDPNTDAVAHACRDILPLVRAARPDVVLRVVGRGGAAAVAALAGTPGLELVGEVDDLAPELAAAHLAVVPLRFGGGTRVKILEAFAHGLPVVATPIGAEGLPVTSGVECELAAAPDAFAAACLRLLDDPVAARSMAARAEALARASYSAAAVQAEVAAIVARAASA